MSSRDRNSLTGGKSRAPGICEGGGRGERGVREREGGERGE